MPFLPKLAIGDENNKGILWWITRDFERKFIDNKKDESSKLYFFSQIEKIENMLYSINELLKIISRNQNTIK